MTWHARVLRGLAVAIVTATIGATGVGFWLSYGGLHDFAVLGGLSGPESWAWPASVDLFTLAGELGITISAITSKGDLRADVLSWVLSVAGFAPSVAFNLMHVMPSMALVAHYAVAAVPPVAAMLALGALLRQAYRLVSAVPSTSGKAVPAAPASDAETAALVSLRATAAAGNPWSQNALQKHFGLTYAQARKVREEVLPPVPETAALNGDGPHE